MRLLDKQLETFVFERGEIEPDSSDYGWENVYCYCGHVWHSGPCKGKYRMSKRARGYNRSRPCACDSPKLSHSKKIVL